MSTHQKNRKSNKPQTSVTPPPQEQAPGAPASFDPKEPVGHDVKVSPTLVALASLIGQELSSPSFESDFGSKLDPSSLTDGLAKASAWRAEKVRSRGWLAYITQGDASAWRFVNKELERFRQVFECAVALDASVRARYPQTAEMFRAKSAVGVRAGATRARNKVKKEADAKAAAAQQK
jgi:hypothetical protein